MPETRLQKNCFWGFSTALLLLGLLVASAPADTHRIEAERGFVELGGDYETERVDDEGRPVLSVTWMAAAGVDFLERYTKDGRQVCILYLGPGEYVIRAIVSDWEARRLVTDVWIVTVKGEPKPPEPEPDPEPDLSAVAKKVADLSKGWGDREELAVVFETVASMIAAGGLTTVEEVNSELVQRTVGLNTPEVLKSYVVLHLDEVAGEKSGKDVDKARKALEEFVKGLRA